MIFDIRQFDENRGILSKYYSVFRLKYYDIQNIRRWFICVFFMIIANNYVKYNEICLGIL